MAGAPTGNANREKFKTSAQRQEVCRLLCEHLRKGYSRSTFSLMGSEALKRYMAAYPEDFSADDIEEAERIGINRLEKHLLQQSELGDTRATIFALKNRAPESYRDKQEVDHRGTVETILPEMSRDEIMLDCARRIAFILSSSMGHRGCTGRNSDGSSGGQDLTNHLSFSMS